MSTRSGGRSGFQLPHRGLVQNLDRSMVPRSDIPRSKFTGSWTRKGTYDAGLLYPILVDECLPGDHMSYDVTLYMRMATPLFPIFDNQRIDTHFFFVPNRLLWDKWQRFMGEQLSPGDSIDFTVPAMSLIASLDVGSLGDHMGLPINTTIGDATVSALPFRAYRLIFNEWYRDENLVTLTPPSTGDGPDAFTSYVLQRRAKTADYFTSALPWPQKFTAPMLPLVGRVPITGIGMAAGSGFPIAGATGLETSGLTVPYPFSTVTSTSNAVRIRGTAAAAGSPPDIWADMTTARFGINTLREAFQIQALMERDARGGTRYTEIVKSHFGVESPDARMQRPEYIGGGSTSLNVTPVAQTAPTDGLTVGALGGAATGVGSHRASYAATEHGWIIGLLSIKSELSYQQGIPRMFSRRTRYDFYFPSLANLGEQAILMKEIYYDPATSANVFGYQERWQEYRTRYSEIVGAFRSLPLGSLDAWHLGQYFDPAPSLGATFIGDEPPMDRVLAAGEEAEGQQYFGDLLFRRTAVRPLPTFSVPASLGRF